MRYIFLFCAAILFVSCGQNSDYMQMKVYDKTYKNELTKKLDAEGVPYSVEGNVIKYKSEYGDEIENAMTKVNVSHPALFTVKNKSLGIRFERKLSEQNIPYKLRSDEQGGSVFVIDSAYRARASKLLKEAATSN